MDGFGKTNKMKQRRMLIRVSTPRRKDQSAAPRFVLKKPILAEKCYTEITERILSTFTKCGDCY